MVTWQSSSEAIERPRSESDLNRLQQNAKPRSGNKCRRIAIGLLTMLLVAAVSSTGFAQQEKPPGEDWKTDAKGQRYKATAGEPGLKENPMAPDGKPDLTNASFGQNVSINGRTSIQRLMDEWAITSTNCDPETVTIPDNSKKKKSECRLDRKDGKLYMHEIEYAEYSCRQVPQLRRIILSWKKTEKPCTPDDYYQAKLDAQKYEESSSEWPDPPPPPPPPPKSSCTAPLRVKPILVRRGDGAKGVVWQDDEGNQYVVMYNPDGTTEGFPGTPPPKPDESEIGKWQIPPDVQKRLEKIKDTAKELEKSPCQS